MSEAERCTCDESVEDRFHRDHFARVMNAAMPVYQSIADLVRVNYGLANELLTVTKERDQLIAERAQTDGEAGGTGHVAGEPLTKSPRAQAGTASSSSKAGTP